MLTRPCGGAFVDISFAMLPLKSSPSAVARVTVYSIHAHSVLTRVPEAFVHVQLTANSFEAFKTQHRSIQWENVNDLNPQTKVLLYLVLQNAFWNWKLRSSQPDASSLSYLKLLPSLAAVKNLRRLCHRYNRKHTVRLQLL